jgi:hypothetical protein
VPVLRQALRYSGGARVPQDVHSPQPFNRLKAIRRYQIGQNSKIYRCMHAARTVQRWLTNTAQRLSIVMRPHACGHVHASRQWPAAHHTAERLTVFSRDPYCRNQHLPWMVSGSQQQCVMSRSTVAASEHARECRRPTCAPMDARVAEQDG